MATKKNTQPDDEKEKEDKKSKGNERKKKAGDGPGEFSVCKLEDDAEDAESKDVYVKQPYPVSAMQADLNLEQLRILAAVMMKLVLSVKGMFDGEKRNLAHLCNENGRLEVAVRFSDVTDNPRCYLHVEQSAKAFMALYYRHEDKDRRIIELTHFVDRVHFPSDTKTRKYIMFEFTEEQAEKILDFNIYSTYLASVIYNINRKYAARLYMLFNSMRGYARNGCSTFHWYVDYGELRKILGIDEAISRTSVKQKAYKLYKDFKKRVLEESARELRELADEGRSDCWFEYREMPDDFEGHPERLDFTVHVCEEMGKELLDGKEEGGTFRERLKDMLGFSDKDVDKIEEHVATGRGEECVRRAEERLLLKAEEIVSTMEKKGDLIKNKKIYALVSLICEAEAIEEEWMQAEAKGAGMEGNADGDVRNGAGDGSREAGGAKGDARGGQQEPSERDRERMVAWVRDRWLSAVGMKMYNMYIGTAAVMWRKGIEVEVDHDDTARWFGQNREELERAVGMSFKVGVKG